MTSSLKMTYKDTYCDRYKGFFFNVLHVCLNAYDPVYRLRVCYVYN